MLNAESAAPVYQHASEIRGRNIFAEVREAFWKQEPQVAAVLSQISSSRIFVVPLFMSEGYFSEEIIPRELGFRRPGEESWSRKLWRGERALFYCKPIGTHERMSEVVLSRAREIVGTDCGGPAARLAETTLLIAGHGTEKNENSRASIERQVSLMREKHLYAAVDAIFLEEEPRIESWNEFARTQQVVIVPFFISDGLHTQEDIPMLLGMPEEVVRQRLKNGEPVWQNPTEINGKTVWYTPSIGTAREVSEIILERVREAERGSPFF